MRKSKLYTKQQFIREESIPPRSIDSIMQVIYSLKLKVVTFISVRHPS